MSNTERTYEVKINNQIALTTTASHEAYDHLWLNANEQCLNGSLPRNERCCDVTGHGGVGMWAAVE